MDKVFGLTCDFYDLLEANSEMQDVEGVELPVFTGSLTEIFKQLDVGQAYYGTINSALRELGCVHLLRRGSRGITSMVSLHHRPTEDEYIIFRNRPLTTPVESATLAAEVKAIRQQLGGLDIVKALENFDKRLRAVERKVSNES